MNRRRSEKTKPSKKQKQEDLGTKRRRLPKNQSPKSISEEQEKCNEEEEEERRKEEDGKHKFYGCYLLTSLCPRFKGHTYIGFTVNPKRRIRQHNGEITCGAFRTKKKRPWEMVLCIHGFPSNVAALQFEWAWQHPRESIAVREAAASFKTLGGLANKIKLALTMLTLHSWQSMDLTVSFFSTKYMTHASGGPSLPHQMKLHFCSMDELPCYMNSDLPNSYEDEDDLHSNDNELSANDSNERLDSSAVESIESDNISAVDPLGIRGPLENGSSSMMDPLENRSYSMMDPRENGYSSVVDSLESGSSSTMDSLGEHMQSLHQLPVDIDGSTWNDMNEHVRFNKDNGADEFRSSFPVIEEHSSMVGTTSATEDTAKKDNITCIDIDDIDEEHCEPRRILSPFRFADSIRPYTMEGVKVIEEKGSFSMDSLGEHMQSLHQLPIDVNNVSTWNDLSKHVRYDEENGAEELRSSFPVIEEHSSVVGTTSVTENTVKKDNITCIDIDDIAEEPCEPRRILSPFRFADSIRPYTKDGIEVIELCTPSPELRITTGSKKKRFASNFSDIIDLTASPSIIEL